MALLLLFLVPRLNHKTGGLAEVGMEANGEPGHPKAESAGEVLSESELEKIGLRKQILRVSLSTQIRKIR